jgi:leucyl/phenylalanyl-tRNA--protein transferase
MLGFFLGFHPLAPIVKPPPPIPWLNPGEAFPPVENAWGPLAPAPGLLAAGGILDVPTLLQAYRSGIFPWFSGDQPILWWSTDPRMVLYTEEFRLHDSLRKQIRALLKSKRLQVRIDSAFTQVINQCAKTPRHGQNGSWIVDDIIQAYGDLHRAGHAHSVETWLDGELAGGLYAVNIGHMVYGESMFCRVSNASKMALCGLVAFCRQHGLPLIDCQQETTHLGSLGGRPIGRTLFMEQVSILTSPAAPPWHFEPVYWSHVLQ